MKKVWCIILSLLLVISFTACGKTLDISLATNAVNEFKNELNNPDGFKVISDVKVLNIHMIEDKKIVRSVLVFDYEITKVDGSTAKSPILLLVGEDGHIRGWTTARTKEEVENRPKEEWFAVQYYLSALEDIDKYGTNPRSYPSNYQTYSTTYVVEKDDINNAIK